MNWRLLSFPTVSISLGLALALGLMLGLRSYFVADSGSRTGSEVIPNDDPHEMCSYTYRKPNPKYKNRCAFPPVGLNCSGGPSKICSSSTHATTVAAIYVENPPVKITKGSGVNKLEVTIRDGCENIAFKGKPVKGAWYLSKNTRIALCW